MSYDSVVCAVSSEHHYKEMNLGVLAKSCRWRWKAQAAKSGKLDLLSLSMHSCVVSVCPLEWCMSPSNLSSFAQVSLTRTWCTGALHLWEYTDFKKERCAVWQTDSAVWVKVGGGVGGWRDKCIKNGSVPLWHFVWWGSSGVIVTLTGTIKDVSSREKGIWNDPLEGKVNPALRLTFLNGGWKLSQCVSAPALCCNLHS